MIRLSDSARERIPKSKPNDKGLTTNTLMQSSLNHDTLVRCQLDIVTKSMWWCKAYRDIVLVEDDVVGEASIVSPRDGLARRHGDGRGVKALEVAQA